MKFLLLLFVLFAGYPLIQNLLKTIKKRNLLEKHDKRQNDYKKRTELITQSDSNHAYIKSVIKEIESISSKSGSLFVDANLMVRIEVAECILNNTVYEVELPINIEFGLLFAHNSALIKKVYSNNLEELERELDSHAQDYFYDTLDERFGHLDDFEERVEIKLQTWLKKGLTAKINLYNKHIFHESEDLETILGEIKVTFKMEDFGKYIRGLQVTAVM
jgi:hypothetical protein